MSHKKNGFTLVEMIVTLSILSILLSVSVFSMVVWQENSRFNQQNEYAETLFVAAQNQLAEYSRNGKLEKLQKEITNYEGDYERILDVTKLTNGEGVPYEKDSVWYESSGKGDEASKYQGVLCYVSCKAGDYEKYKAGTLGSAEKERGADILFELLSSYVYDDSILNHSISIEFSPDEGQVFAVCYSDRSAVFVYEDPSVVAATGYVNIAKREESYRKEHMIGYYGVDTLASSTSSGGQKPVLSQVVLNNEETLNLSFKVLKAPGAAQQLKYNLNVYDKETKQLILSFTLDGSMIHNYSTRRTVSCDVTRYSYDDSGKQTAQDLGDYDILAWIDSDEMVRIVFDAADIQATSTQYLNDLKSGDAGLKGKLAADTVFASTYSFHRFGVDAENIYCTIQATGVNYKTTAMKQSNSQAAYFATAKHSVVANEEQASGTTDIYEYTIENGRHLYNVRFAEDIDASDENKYNDSVDSDSIIHRYEVTKNVDWNEFVASGSLYYTKEGTLDISSLDSIQTIQLTGADGSDCVRLLSACDFPSIKQLRYGDTFAGNGTNGLNVNNKSIKNLSIRETSNVLFGVYNTGIVSAPTTSEILTMAGSQADLSQTDTLTEERPVGLFVNNYGTITKLGLDGITVEGNKKIGAFCGSNGGSLSNLEVKSSDEDSPSTITGQENVGGIMGYQESLNDSKLHNGTAATPVLSNLTNRAKVSGRLYVGGIVGEIHIPDDSTEPVITIEGCKNYGAIVARNSEALEGATTMEAKTEPRYLGGIVGYCNNEYVDETGTRDVQHLLITGCISSPQYSEEDLDLFLERNQDDADDDIGQITDESYQGKNLRGVYVGGIVGYNYYGTIESCSTEAESGKTGYVFGYQYVGGIVGFNQGPAAGIVGGNSAASGSKGVNEINVVGYQYVGGITGCNSDVLCKEGTDEADLDAYQVIQPDPATNLFVKVSNWENRGVIVAIDSYAGGITGYNSGWLYNCDSKVRNSETNGFFQETYSGDYAGGIAGYNNGVIGKTERTVSEDGTSSVVVKAYTGSETTICYVTGKNYVGGIVGYNDVDSVVEDYGIAGGKIRGSGSFVGGYAGFNASLNLLMDDDNQAHRIVSKPNEVSGKYFVGGNIGGNIVDCTNYFTEDRNSVNARFETNNFFGRVTAEAFAGGFVGYNILLTDTSKTQIDELQKALLDEFDKIDSGVAPYTDYVPAILPTDMDASELSADVLHMMEKVEVLDNLESSLNTTVTRADGKMVIAGDEDSKTQNRLGRIAGKIYLGGVIGYNDEETALEIRYVTNTTPIQATMAIPNADEQTNRSKEYDGETFFTYSYAGGIIGKATEKVVIYQCENGAGAGVTASGTYTGGLVEVNEGTIEKCEVSSLGDASMDYIGGICGLNKSNGTITSCIMQDKTVNGRNYVGGIVAENFGIVQDSVIQNKKNSALKNTTIHAVGVKVLTGDEEEKQGITGCVAAYNTGTISQSTDLIDIKVISGGNSAGGLVGVNDGNVINAKTDNKIRITGSISGQKSIGGVIGVNKGTTTTIDSANNQVSGYRNEATVTAEQGDAGGILGSNEGNSDIRDCENAGEIIARQSGNAGGITAENYAHIIDCIDYGKVSAPNGDCGGIAAWNYEGAFIQNCQVVSPNDDSMLEFTAKETVGGITSHNEGSIVNPKLVKVSVYNYTNSPASNIGVVAGRNYSTGTITLGKEDEDSIEAIVDCEAKTYTDNSNVGGVAGLNQGTISAPVWYQEVTLKEGEEDLTTREFQMPKAWVSCSVGYMNAGVSYGDLGGVAGDNQGIIENIGVKSTTVQGKIGSTTTGIGGIAGISAPAGTLDTSVTENPMISNCTFDGMITASGTYANAVYMGGIVGLNQAGCTIYGCRIGVAEKTVISNGDSTATSQYGYVGGIVGNTYGNVIACDSYHTDGTTATVTIETNAGQVGGVAGIQQTGAQITGEQNRRMSTGKDWTISYYRYINDHAIGGIVGSSYSNEACEYVSNYATILYVGETPSSTHFNMSRAGIIGRLWPESTASVRFAYCYNYGDVLGKTSATGTSYVSQGRSGGLIGQLQYAGVTLESCKNYGLIRGCHYAGGMIGCVYMPMTDIEVISCENHGNLHAGNAASGMIACRYRRGSVACEFIYYDCVNTGLVGTGNNTTSRSGMGLVLQNETPDTYVTGYYAQCQNYGYGISNNSFGGIQNGVTTYSILNSFDMGGGIFSQTASVTNQSGNYFVNRDSFTMTDTATGNSASTRLNYSDGALYLGTTITSVQDLTVLTNGTAGSNAYYNDRTASYVVGAEDSEQNIRYRTYLEMHEAVADYIKSTYCATNIANKTKLDAPQNITLNYRTNAGYDTLVWDAVEQAYSYEIRYTVTKTDGTTETKSEEVIGLCRLRLGTDDMENAAKLRVEIRAKDGCGDESHYSDWTVKDDFVIKTILPAPKYHFELLYNGINTKNNTCNNGRMIAVLDNPEDYIKDGAKIADITITGYGTWTIDPTVGYSIVSQATSGGQKQTRAYAVPVNTSQYVQSPYVSNVTYIAGPNVMNTQYNSIQYNGFYGDTGSNLSYSITIGENKIDKSTFVGFYMQEVMADDDEVGTTISYSHGQTRKDFTGDETLELSGFPVDLTSKESITVMNLYWAAQGNSTYYGHTVAEEVSLSELRKLMDTQYYSLKANKNGSLTTSVEKSSQSIWATQPDMVDGKLKNGTLNDGYIIYKNTNGTYSVYYSALYAGQTKLERLTGSQENTVGGLTQMVYTRDGSDADDTAVYKFLDDTIPVQPKPVLSDLQQDADGTYVFTWDVGMSEDLYKNAVYTVELTGTTVDGSTVALDTAEGIAWQDGKAVYQIQPQDNWNYKSLTISVSRHGAVDSNNKTISFPSGTEVEYPIRMTLSQIGAPTVNHDTDEQGNSNMDELLYHVIWSGVQTEEEKNDLGGYLITVVSDGTNAGEKTATHYYYVLEQGQQITDSIQKLMDASQIDGTSVTDVTDSYDTTNANALQATINLEDYMSEELISVSVTALAKQNADVYLDGPDGAEQSLRLPGRLAVPDVSELLLNYGTEPASIKVSDYDAEVFRLTYTDASDEATQQNLRLAVAIYDTLPEGTDLNAADRVLHSGDATNSTDSGYWNSGAQVTLVSKERKQNMSGSMENASYTLTVPDGTSWSDYAGKWLKIVIQSTSNSAISSSWSDEDATDASCNYVWIQLPKAELENVGLTDITDDDSNNRILNTTKWDVVESTAAADYIVTRTLSFDAKNQAEGYQIQVIGKDESVHWIYIAKDEEGYKVYYASTETVIENASDDVVWGSVHMVPVEEGTLTSGDTVDLPYRYEDFVLPGSSARKADIYASLSMVTTENGDTFTLSLPDVLKYGKNATVQDLNADDYQLTSQVSVQAVVYGKTDTDGNSIEANYIPSGIEVWSADSSDILQIDAELEAPDVSGTLEVLTASNSEEYQFRLSSHEELKDNTFLAQILVMDDSGSVIRVRYVMIQPESRDGYGIVTLPKTDFSYTSDDDTIIIQTVQIRFAQMTDNNLSAWTELYELKTDGTLLSVQGK